MKFKENLKRIVCIAMVVLTMLTSAPLSGLVGIEFKSPFATEAEAASIVRSWSFSDVTKLSKNDAQIKATVNLTKSVKISKAGFYIGTSKDNLKKNSKPDTVNKSYKSLPMWFLMSKYGEKLKANTTYYYKFYIIVDGKYYYSAVKNFKTKAESTNSSSLKVTWTFDDVSKLSASDAQIGSTVKLSKSSKIGKAGFYIGTSKDNLKKNSKPDTVNKSYTSLPMWFLMSKYGENLKENTIYYYKFYITVGDKYYFSDVKSFKTKAATTTNAYTIAYSANGGSGSMGKQTVAKNATFKVSENKFTKSGYSFQGWNVQRKSDNKWYVSGEGWKTASEISKNKWTKKVYTPNQSLKMSSSWQNGSKANETFTFYAIWKASPSNLKVTWKYNDVTDLSIDDAQIGATVNLSKKSKIKEAGFYIGTSKDNLKKNSKPDTVNKSYKSLPMWFLMSNYDEKLKANTTYYYKFYVTIGDKLYYSDIKSFKTQKATDFNKKINALKKKYPEGTSWGDKKKANGGYGCYAFAATCLKYVKGRLPGGPVNNKKFADIKVGDMVHYKDPKYGQHWVFVIAKDSNSITVAEGNYNDKVHWNRKISKTYLDKYMYKKDSLRR